MTERHDFGTFGRYQEVPLDDMSPDIKAAYDTTMRLRGQVPGPHKIWLANPALSETVVMVHRRVADAGRIRRSRQRRRSGTIG